MAGGLSHEVDVVCAQVEAIASVAQVSAALWLGETVEQRWREAGKRKTPGLRNVAAPLSRRIADWLRRRTVALDPTRAPWAHSTAAASRRPTSLLQR